MRKDIIIKQRILGQKPFINGSYNAVSILPKIDM